MTPQTESPRDAQALDALLALDRVPAPSPDLRRTILLGFDARMAGGFWRTLWREVGGLRVAGPALAASLALGIAVSTTFSTDPAVTDEAVAPDYTELALFEAPYEEYAL